MSYVADCSIIIRLLASRPGDDLLRQRLARTIHAPALLDAEVSSVVRGLAIAGSPKRITAARAGEMLADYAGLRIVRRSGSGSVPGRRQRAQGLTGLATADSD